MATHNNNHREIDHRDSEKAAVGGLSSNFVELLKSQELMKPADRIAQSGDVLSFSNQTFSSKPGGLDFLTKPPEEFKLNQTAFLTPEAFKSSAAVRLDGKPLNSQA